MQSPALFKPIQVRDLCLRNRIVIAPMCQYSAEDGCMNEWHLMHLGKLAMSGAGLLTIEATAVSPEGRITYADLGLWNDLTYAAMSLTLDSIRRWSDTPIAIQLNHAGRKASTDLPWKGGAQFSPGSGFGWQTVAPSPAPYTKGDHLSASLDKAGIREIRQAFADAAQRAAKAGLDAVQLHVAHGYLLHQFLSPLSNFRTDEYGGSVNNRMKFPLEVFDAVRGVFPSERPVSVRLSATDWVKGGLQLEQSFAFANELKQRGCDVIHVTSGGLDPSQDIPIGPSYQVPFARKIKEEVGLPVVAAGLITGFDQAEGIVSTGDADMVGLARTILFDPNWPWHAAAHLGGKVRAPNQYLRSRPSNYRDLFDVE